MKLRSLPLPFFKIILGLVFGFGMGAFTGLHFSSNVESGKSVDQIRSLSLTRKKKPPNPTTPRFHGYLERLAAAGVSKLPDMFEELHETIPRRERLLYLRMLAARWIELDPHGGAACFSTHEEAINLQSYIGNWALVDPEAAHTFALDLPDKELRERCLRAALYGAGRRSEESLAKLSEKTPQDLDTSDYNRFAFEELGKNDPTQAIAKLDGLEGRALKYAIAGLMRGWADHAPESALAWAQSLSDPSMKEQALTVLLDRWQPVDDGAMGQLIEMMTGIGNERPGIRRARDIYKGDPIKAADWAQRYLSTKSLRLFAETVIRESLQRGEVDEAMRFADAIPDNRLRNMILMSSFPSNPPLDEPMVEKLTEAINAMEPMARSGFAENFFEALDEFPKLEMKALELLDDETFREKIVTQNEHRRLAETVDRRVDLESGLQSLEDLPDELRHRGTMMILASSNPDEAAAFLHRLPEGEHRDRTVSRIAAEWTQVDPLGASTWAAELPNSDRAPAYGRIARHWANADSYEASKWIGTLKEGAPRDAAAAQFATATRHDDPHAAFAWASTISEPGQRANALNEVTTTWVEIDPIAVRETIEASLLGEAERQALLSQLP